MKLNKIKYVAIFVALIGCSKDDDPISLIADAGTNQQVSPMETVTLDGSNSKGPGGFTYEWSYIGEVPESEINFAGKTTANPTFIPPKSTLYSFTLKVSSGGNYDFDEVNVVASGAIEIGGTLSEDLDLYNIEPDPTLPDYIVSTDITVENGIKLSLKEDGIVIQFKEDRGIHLKSGGILTNSKENVSEGYECKLIGNSGWKGILVDQSQICIDTRTDIYPMTKIFS